MGKYAVAGTAVLGTNVTGLTVLGGTTVRAEIYDILLSCASTPADQQLNALLRRITADGTGTSVTPEPLNPDDCIAIATSKRTYTVEPTLTGVAPIDYGLHQRSAVRWVARQGGEIITAKASGAGWGITWTITSGTPTARAVMHFQE